MFDLEGNASTGAFKTIGILTIYSIKSISLISTTLERPGSDALRIQYYGKGNTSTELAINENIQAGLYKFNSWDYDFQTLLAKYYNDYVLGFGWAGQIKEAGFKGEFSYFINGESQVKELVGSIGIDL